MRQFRNHSSNRYYMKNISRFSSIMLALVVCAFHAVSFGQMATQLNYKEKGRALSAVSVYFSNNVGGQEVSPDEFIDYQKIYFTITAFDSDGNGFFKDKDIAEDLSQISLYQNGVKITPAAQLNGVKNPDMKIDKVVMTFNKRDVELYELFEFRSPIDTADVIVLSDKYFMYYYTYEPVYIKGLNYSDEKDYLSAYNMMMEIVDDAQIKSEIRHYSFWQSASENYIQTAIEQYTDSLSRTLTRAHKKFMNGYSKIDLDRQDSVLNLIYDARQTFMPYMQMDFPKSASYIDKFTQLISEADSIIAENNMRFKRNRMRFLEIETYDNSYEFQLYIDIIARMLCNLDTLRTLNGLMPISNNLLDKMPEKKQELVNAEWLDKFNIILDVVNMNIQQKGIVFGDSVMGNLQRQVVDQRQPYHEIFTAFNYMDNNLPLFKTFLSEAVRKCTDLDLIDNLEMWILSYNLTNNDVDTKIVSRINEGIRLIDGMKWPEAESIFGILTRQANNVAPPWFYEGVIKFENGGQFSAESMFERALEINPGYIAPRLFNFEILHEQGDIDGLLTEVEVAINAYDIWFFHFWKARALYAKEMYNEAIAVIENNCNNMNPWNVEAYFLLGDSYRELTNFDKAEEAYRKTVDVDPYMDTSMFDVKMTMLLELKN